MKFKLLQINKKQCLTLLLITLFVAIFRIILQVFIPSSETSPLPPSVIVKAGLLPFAFTIFAIVVYGALAIVFFLIQDNLQGTGIRKGFIFGIAFCIMWFVYLFEPVPYVFEQSLLEFLSYPFVDGAAILVLGLLLGKFIGTDTQGSRKVTISYSLVTVVSISLFFLVPRYLNYSIFSSYSSFTTRPILTMIWTLAGGISIGIVYLLLSPGIIMKSNLLKAVYFGFVVIGIDLFLFNCFVPLVFDQSVFGSLSRAMQDIVPIIVGVYVAEKILFRLELKQKSNTFNRNTLK